MEGWQTFASKNAFLSREIFGLKKLKWSKENFKALAPQMPLAYNGLGIAEVGAFENRQFKYSKKADRRTLVELLPSAPILAIPC